jgi:hypothetical protein
LGVALGKHEKIDYMCAVHEQGNAYLSWRILY